MPSPTLQQRVRIGCAGWSILSRHKPLFESGESVLAAYATRFDCVEINSSFYRPHQPTTYARWAASVPRQFRFSVKLPKLVTHELRLQGAGKPLDAFRSQVEGLGSRLGGILVQLPPSLALEPRSATRFFGMMRRRFPDTRIACEPRHASWFLPEADALWARHDISRVGADPPPVDGADRPAGSTRWRYWRLHGAPRMYYSDYGDSALAALVAQIRSPGGGRARSGECWVMFDNTAHGHATSDALRLRSMLAQARPA